MSLQSIGEINIKHIKKIIMDCDKCYYNNTK